MREIQIRDAVREAVPLITGITGPSGSGKTGSALELAHGYQDAQGGEIGVMDSEANRSLHYAGAPMLSDKGRTFKFKHVPFAAPFGPLDYMAAGEYCVKMGIKHLIVDSTSHMHEGAGGVLQTHASEVERLMAAWKVSGDKANLPAWSKPKQEFDQFKNWFLQQPVNFIFCFRAKEKIKVLGGKPVPMGWQAISTEGMIYEMTVNFLLYPGSNGVPVWNPEEKGEKESIKLPEQFKGICTNGRALSAAMGRELATWAKGGPAQVAPAVVKAAAPVQAQPTEAPVVNDLTPKLPPLLKHEDVQNDYKAIKMAADVQALKDLWEFIKSREKYYLPDDFDGLRAAANNRKTELKGAQ